MLPMYSHNRGFTLLEVLIALSIFSLIGLASYRMLDMVILSQTKVDAHQQQIRTLERAMHMISNDFEQLVERPVRDNYGDLLQAFSSNQQNYLLEFTRQSWRNPLQLPRSQLQRVAYELAAELGSSDTAQQQSAAGGVHLLRHYWRVLDRAPDSKPQTQVLIRNVHDLQLQFMDSEGEWHSQWPLPPVLGEPVETLPRAILVKLDSQYSGNFERLYQLPEFSASQAMTRNKSGNNNPPTPTNDNAAPLTGPGAQQ